MGSPQNKPHYGISTALPRRSRGGPHEKGSFFKRPVKVTAKGCDVLNDPLLVEESLGGNDPTIPSHGNPNHSRYDQVLGRLSQRPAPKLRVCAGRRQRVEGQVRRFSQLATGDTEDSMTVDVPWGWARVGSLGNAMGTLKTSSAGLGSPARSAVWATFFKP